MINLFEGFEAPTLSFLKSLLFTWIHLTYIKCIPYIKNNKTIAGREAPMFVTTNAYPTNALNRQLHTGDLCTLVTQT